MILGESKVEVERHGDNDGMSIYEIWSEGYRISGNASNACFWGSEQGRDFKEACRIFAASNKGFDHNFDPESMTVWGCRLFDNENDARKVFG
jgi:hypothetical protein